MSFPKRIWGIRIPDIRPTLCLLILHYSSTLAFASLPHEQDTAYVDAENKRAFALYGKDPLQMVEIGRQMLILSESIGYDYGRASSLNTLALGHLSMSNYSESAQYFHEALEFYNLLDDDWNAASILSNLGVVHYFLDNHQKSLEYHQQALEIRIQYLDSLDLASGFNNIGIAHKNLENYDQALLYYGLALKFKRQVGDRSALSSTLNNVGNVQLEIGNHAEALKNFQESLDIDLQDKNTLGMATSYANIGKAQMELGNYDEAEALLKKSLETAREVDADRIRLLALEYLQDLHERSGEYRLSLQMLKKWAALNDSLKSTESQKAIEELETSYQLAGARTENEALKSREQLQDAQITRQKIFLIGTILFITLLLIMLYLVYRSLQLKKSVNRTLEQKNAEILRQAGQLQEINEAKNKMLSVLTHDIKAPMTNLQSLIALIQSEQISQLQTNMVTSQLNDQVMTVSQLMTNILEWVKSQMGGIQIKPVNLDLRVLLDEMVANHIEAAKRKKIQLHSLVDQECMVIADKDMLRSVLQNLITNAIKFTEEGKVQLDATERDTLIWVTITDTGMGIPSEEQKMLFTSDQISSKGTLDEEGTGIGLLLVREFVMKNGGDLSVESQLGLGTTITFTLPKA